MSKTPPPIASPNRLPKRYFTLGLVLFMVDFEWISPRNGEISGVFLENRVLEGG